jgi:hypothetical protein
METKQPKAIDRKEPFNYAEWKASNVKPRTPAGFGPNGYGSALAKANLANLKDCGRTNTNR